MSGQVMVEGEKTDRDDWTHCDECDENIWDHNMQGNACVREREWWDERFPKTMSDRKEQPHEICKECFRALLAQEDK